MSDIRRRTLLALSEHLVTISQTTGLSPKGSVRFGVESHLAPMGQPQAALARLGTRAGGVRLAPLPAGLVPSRVNTRAMRGSA